VSPGARKKLPKDSGLPLVDGLEKLNTPSVTDYVQAASEYIRSASVIDEGQRKTAQLRLSKSLAMVALCDLRACGLALTDAIAGEHDVGGGLRSVQVDLSENTRTDGLTLALEIKPVHLAVGRAIWNRFGDIRSFAVNVHLKFPFAVLGGVMTIPTKERGTSGKDNHWRSTTHLIAKAIGRFIRAGGRQREGDAAHLLEGIAVLVFDPDTATIDVGVPPVGSNLRWDEFIRALADTYSARFGEL